MGKWEELVKLIDADPDEAVRRACKELDKNPDDSLQLFVIGEVMSRAERYGFAANIYRQVTLLNPTRAEAWNNLGMCYSGLGENLRAREAFFKAYNLKKESAMFSANIGMTFFTEREYPKAIEWCKRSLNFDPACKAAKNTLGMSYLATGKWDPGWELYSASVGGKFRRMNQYQNEGMWDGTPGQTVVFYGEQGLGDEIMFASCIEEASKVCKTTILECDKRLESLFRRSFPGIEIHGTRRQDAVPWLNDYQIDASLPVGQLPQFFRKSPKDCPGKPYLKADPERRVQWRALFDSLGPKPKIGIAWSGGSKHNKPKERAVGLDAMRPLIESLDAEWISLQYKDPTEEIKASRLPIKHYKRACETDDYDDTAAMVAELDMVIGVHTSVHHLAGALGVPGIVLIPSRTIWIWSMESMPWYSTATLFKQKDGESWKETIKRLTNDSCVRGLRSSGGASLPRLHSIPAGHGSASDPSDSAVTAIAA